MEDKIKDKLSSLTNLISKRNTISPGDMLLIMSNSRKLLELTKSKSQYPVLNLYCNWLFHSEISRGEEVAKIFLRFTQAIADSCKKSEGVNSAMSAGLSLEVLRKNFIDLFLAYGLTNDQFQDDYFWHAFLRMMFKELDGATLRFPEVRGTKHHNSSAKKVIEIERKMKLVLFKSPLSFSQPKTLMIKLNDKNNYVWCVTLHASEGYPGGVQIEGDITSKLNMASKSRLR